ncbi:MAG: M4 family metallopeptidase, partial [Anaerolineae bacterium]
MNQELLQQLHDLAGDDPTISYHAQTGRVRFMSVTPGHAIPPLDLGAAPTTPEQAARSFLTVFGDLFGLTDQSQDLSLLRLTPDEAGFQFVHFQQVYQGVPVLGGELIVQLTADLHTAAVTGEILPVPALAITPTFELDLAQQQALEVIARAYVVPTTTLTSTTPALWVYNPTLLGPGSGFTSLVWRLEITAQELAPIRELVLVDARRGGVVLHFNQVDAALNRQTYTANNGTTLPGTLVCNESNPTCSGGDAHAVAAHRYAGDTYNFYFNNHNRDSMDGAGMTLKSTVHYRSGYQNAFWNGSQMVYGDGYGFPLADDVVAHELTHGVTEHESDLFYYYQSGAINESFSDLWGEFVDLTNNAGNDTPAVRWLLGEDITGLGAIRNMQNPPAYGDPDRMRSHYYVLSDSDNGGVHTNSGINNKAAYLMTDGGGFNSFSVRGLGIVKVAKIYYEVQTHLLVSGADYADLYDALYQACNNLIGTAGITAGDCQQVRLAANAVEMNLQPLPNFNSDAPWCDGSQPHTVLFADDLENGPSNWQFGALSGTGRWRYDSSYGAYAHSGGHFLYADDYPAAVSDSYATMINSVTLPTGAYLRFAHAYGLDHYYDGGVIEYSTDNGSSWLDAGGLIDYNGYKGTLSSYFGNPIGGRSAFTADSHGYITSRLNLASLAGRNVRFRWRMGTDRYDYHWGWWLDDVNIYQCQPTTITPSHTPTYPPEYITRLYLHENYTLQTSPQANTSDIPIRPAWPTREWTYTLIGDITEPNFWMDVTVYTLFPNQLPSCYDADLVLNHSGSVTTLAHVDLGCTWSSGRYVGEVSSIDPNAQAGDRLTFRLSYTGGAYGGAYIGGDINAHIEIPTGIRPTNTPTPENTPTPTDTPTITPTPTRTPTPTVT